VRNEPIVRIDRIDDFDEIIDVRSPAEFALDRVPGAVNCPVLDDQERARVGTVYKQVSSFAARKLGAALVARNVARHLEGHFASREPGWRPLVYCWRGGKRSESMAHVLREVGWQAATLAGGYQGYRRDLLVQLDALPFQFDLRVICGPTGSGKSRLLQTLAARGAQVLDLERLACHRGSVLGDLPGASQPSQKMFDSVLWDALRRHDRNRPVFVEAESRKIGVLRLPEALLRRLHAAPCVRLQVPLDERARFLIEEYRHFLDDPGWLRQRLTRLAALHSKRTVARWMALIDDRQWASLVRDLIALHYDPAYRKSLGNLYPGQNASTTLEMATLDNAGFASAADALLNG
jgi:tRNA 2-selenouridine synthase